MWKTFDWNRLYDQKIENEKIRVQKSFLEHFHEMLQSFSSVWSDPGLHNNCFGAIIFGKFHFLIRPGLRHNCFGAIECPTSIFWTIYRYFPAFSVEIRAEASELSVYAEIHSVTHLNRSWARDHDDTSRGDMPPGTVCLFVSGHNDPQKSTLERSKQIAACSSNRKTSIDQILSLQALHDHYFSFFRRK